MQSAHDAIVEAYKAFEDAFFRGDSQTLAEIYADDAEWLVRPGIIPSLESRSRLATRPL
jgi:ketosteroid isomerase-like protein